MSLTPDCTPDCTFVRYVNVLVDCIGIDDLLTYGIPEDVDIQIGDILSVPLGTRHVGAIALQISDASTIDTFKIKDIEVKSISAVVSSGIFPQNYWQMLIRTADYYRTPLIQTVKTALPPKLLDQSHYRIKIKNQNLFPPKAEEDFPNKLPNAAQMVWDFCKNIKIIQRELVAAIFAKS